MKERLCTMFAAFCFGMYGLVNFGWYISTTYYGFATSAYYLMFVLLALLLLVRKMNIVFLVPVSYDMLYLIWLQRVDQLLFYAGRPPRRFVAFILAYAVLVSLLAINTITPLKRFSYLTKFYWYVPASVFIYGLVSNFTFQRKYGVSFESLIVNKEFWLDSIVAVGLYFTGVWLLNRFNSAESISQNM